MIAIRFIGICTHLRKTGPDPHRVVLVNADKVFLHPKLTGIPVHHARLITLVGTIPLDGVIVRIPTPAPLDYTGWTGVLPRPDVGKLSDAVVREENAEEAAAYVDVEGGTFSICCRKKAMVTTVTFPGPLTLLMRRFGDSVWEPLPLADGSVAAFVNASDESEDRPDDHRHFHLHYLVGGNPGVERAQPPGKECKELPECPVPKDEGGISLGPGCSNSEYP